MYLFLRSAIEDIHKFAESAVVTAEVIEYLITDFCIYSIVDFLDQSFNRPLIVESAYTAGH